MFSVECHTGSSLRYPRHYVCSNHACLGAEQGATEKDVTGRRLKKQPLVSWTFIVVEEKLKAILFYSAESDGYHFVSVRCEIRHGASHLSQGLWAMLEESKDKDTLSPLFVRPI